MIHLILEKVCISDSTIAQPVTPLNGVLVLIVVAQASDW